MRKEVLVFIFDGYADWESAYVCSELNTGNTEYIIKTISTDKTFKISRGGFRVLPDYTIDDYPTDFSLLILPGGDAWLEHKNDSIISLVEYAVKSNIPVGAICFAVNFLAANGFLNNIKHSGNTLEFIKSHAPQYTGDDNYLEKQAVCDRNIITANGSGALEFSKEILKLMKAKSEKDILNWYNHHKFGLYQ